MLNCKEIDLGFIQILGFFFFTFKGILVPTLLKIITNLFSPACFVLSSTDTAHKWILNNKRFHESLELSSHVSFIGITDLTSQSLTFTNFVYC